MDFLQASSVQMRAAQIITGATMAAFILVGVVPALRAHAMRIRQAILVVYLVIAAGFMVWLMVR